MSILTNLTNSLYDDYSKASIQKIGINGYDVFVKTSETVNRNADVPNIAVESGNFINDHVILKPLTLSISGIVSDIIVRPSIINNQINKVNTLIGNFNQFLSGKTEAQIQITNSILRQQENVLQGGLNILDSVNEVAKYSNQILTNQSNLDATKLLGDALGNDINSIINDPNNINNFKQSLNDTMSLKGGNDGIEIEVDNIVYKRMVITSFSMSNNNVDNNISFSLSAQQIITATSFFVANENNFNVNKVADNVKDKVQNPVKKNLTNGKKQETSILYGSVRFIKNVFGGR